MTLRSLTNLGRGAAALALALQFTGGAVAQVPLAPPSPPPFPSAPPVAPKPAKHLVGPPGVAAVVNGKTITKSQVMALAFQLGGPEILDRLINNTLVDQAAKKQGIVVTPAEINARVAQIRQQIARSPQGGGSLDALLQQSHETMANFRDSLRLRLEADKLASKSLSPVRMVHAEYLLVATNNPRPGADVKVKSDADAQKIIAKAQDELKGGKKFEDVVKEYSDDPTTKDKNGDLGIIGPGSGLDPNFLNAALQLKKGEITPTPVKAPQFGYFLIKAVSTSADPLDAKEKASYATAMDAARQAQLQQVLPGYLQNLRAKAKVSNYLSP